MQKFVLYAMPVHFDDLWKIVAPVGFVEGFDLSAFDEICQKARNATDAAIEAHSLWEYTSICTGLPVTLAIITYSYGKVYCLDNARILSFRWVAKGQFCDLSKIDDVKRMSQLLFFRLLFFERVSITRRQCKFWLSCSFFLSRNYFAEINHKLFSTTVLRKFSAWRTKLSLKILTWQTSSLVLRFICDRFLQSRISILWFNLSNLGQEQRMRSSFGVNGGLIKKNAVEAH